MSTKKIKTGNRTAICAGSFDPPTLGHFNIIERGLKIFDKLIVAVAINTSKNSLLSVKERVQLLTNLLKTKKNVEVVSFDGLLVDYACKRGVSALLRGIRNMSDYEYESQMAMVNKVLHPKLETVFMMTEGKYSHLSSTFIREILTFGGSCKGMIDPMVEEKLKRCFQTASKK
ncbi:MAG: pantetheine-phosphate adenylyltransferase [Deltaproteobacteria bacterium]|nr:pantetheine-phosphate adenylyltransferase [Deltaproteobacteria bacterium]